MRLAFFAILALAADAQPLRVYSEFVAFDAAGEPASPVQPREILSPAIVRNGFTSFQIVVQEPSGTHWTLYVGENPEHATRVTLYRETGDHLEPVEPPVQGEGLAIYWMDVWAERAAPVRRIKIEPQLAVGHDWVTYPMEVRLVSATVPDGSRAGTLRAFLCGGADNSPPLRHRNAEQDAALAQRVPREELSRIFGDCGVSSSTDPEAYLRVRDYLLRSTR